MFARSATMGNTRASMSGTSNKYGTHAFFFPSITAKACAPRLLNRKMKISCIVPVYNTSKYLKQCLGSLINQTHRDTEIIIVNDCSTDNSASICQEYAQQYPDRVVFINKAVNEGVDKARFDAINYLLSCNSADCVTFIDSDDYVEPEALAQLAKAMAETDADVIEMRNSRCIRNFKFKRNPYIEAKTISQPQLFDDYYVSFFGINILSVSIWGKLYRLDLFRKAKLTPSGFKMGEDLIMNMKLFPFINRYRIIDYYGYNYRVGGLTSRYNPTLWTDLKSQYYLKRQQLVDCDYMKALKPLNIELKNILISAIIQRISFLKKSDDTLRQWVLAELNDTVLWHDIEEMSETEPDPIYKYIATKDADSIILIVKERLHEQRWRRRTKKLLIHLSKLFGK